MQRVESIFERALRCAAEERERGRNGRTLYRNIVVVHGATVFRKAADLAGSGRLQVADLVIGLAPERVPDDPPVGTVLKDRYGAARERIVLQSDPCPCQGGRRFGVCHGR